MAIKLFVKIEDLTNNGFIPVEVDAEILPDLIGGKTHFVHRAFEDGYDWAISEYSTGARAGRGLSIQGALKVAEDNINNVGPEKYAKMLEDVIAQHGIANAGQIPEASKKTYDDIEEELFALAEAEEDDNIE